MGVGTTVGRLATPSGMGVAASLVPGSTKSEMLPLAAMNAWPQTALPGADRSTTVNEPSDARTPPSAPQATTVSASAIVMTCGVANSAASDKGARVNDVAPVIPAGAPWTGPLGMVGACNAAVLELGWAHEPLHSVACSPGAGLTA